MQSRTAYRRILGADRCVYCGARVEHVDHIEPKCGGGADEWDNLTAACASCNMSKGKAKPLDFLLARLGIRGPASPPRTSAPRVPDSGRPRRRPRVRHRAHMVVSSREDVVSATPPKPLGPLDTRLLRGLQAAAEEVDSADLLIDLPAAAEYLLPTSPERVARRRVNAAFSRLFHVTVEGPPEGRWTWWSLIGEVSYAGEPDKTSSSLSEVIGVWLVDDVVGLARGPETTPLPGVKAAVHRCAACESRAAQRDGARCRRGRVRWFVHYSCEAL